MSRVTACKKCGGPVSLQSMTSKQQVWVCTKCGAKQIIKVK